MKRFLLFFVSFLTLCGAANADSFFFDGIEYKVTAESDNDSIGNYVSLSSVDKSIEHANIPESVTHPINKKILCQ